MTPVSDPAILAQLNGGAGKPVTDSAVLAQLNAKQAQPTMMQNIIASPVGRFVHDAVLPMLSAPGELLSHIDPTAPDISALKASNEQGYQGALAAQRNSPGYAAARQQADAIQSKSGGGLTDQFIAPVLPTAAGLTGGLFGGSWDAMNANADAASAGLSAYQKANPVLSTGAQLAGGLLTGPEMAKLPAKVPPVVAPTIADLKKAAKTAYKQVDNSGIVVAGPSYDQMVTDLHAKLDKLGIDPALHPDATAALNRLNDLRSQAAGGAGAAAPADVPFQKLNTLREIAGDAAGAVLPRDAMRGGVIQDHIDDYVDNLTHADLSGAGATQNPTATVAALNDARDLYSRAKQAQTIQSVIDKADIRATANYSQSGQENSLRQGFKSLALNDRAMARLSPDVQIAVKAVAKGAPVSNLLRSVGKYAPHGPVATAAGMGLGAMTGGVAGAAEGGLASLAVPIAGEMARSAATRLTKAAAQRAYDAAALGRGAIRPLPQPPLQLPNLTPQSQIPFGLFGSSAALQQQQR